MQIKLNNNIMNLIGLNAYLVLFCIYLTKLKKNTLNIVILFLFGLLNSLLKQENSCFYNSSNYYQLVSFLNTKNNIVVVVLLLYIMFLNSLKTKKNITCTITMFVLYDYNYFDNTNNLFMSF